MRVDFTSQDGQIDPFWTLWMTSVIESEEETIFINRITAGSASRVCNTTHHIYQPQRRSSKLREFQLMLPVHGKNMGKVACCKRPISDWLVTALELASYPALCDHRIARS